MVCNGAGYEGTRERTAWIRILLGVAVLLAGCLGPAGVSAAQNGDAVREIAAPPTYSGTVDNSADCGRIYETRGYVPSTAGAVRYPLFL